MARWRLLGLALFGLFVADVATAQNLPQLTGRVVDQANLISPEHEAALTARLEALERSTTRQLVVVTVPDLQGQSDSDFAFRLGESWRLGNAEADNGAILLVAPSERKVRIEVGDGLEPILTDAMSHIIIRDAILPRFRENDYPGGINAGVNAILEQLQAPPEVAEQRALEAAAAQRAQGSGGGASFLGVLFWIVAIVVLIAFLARSGMRRGGRRYGTRRRRRGWGGGPVIIWGGGWGSGGGSSGGGWGGFGGGGGGGFSGGGGSFGGGGASGSW